MTLYSHPAYIFNAPEPSFFDSEFIYNFYDKNETTRGLTVPDSDLSLFEESTRDGEYKNKFKIVFENTKKISKFNKISWTQRSHKKWDNLSTNPILFESNYPKIISEANIPFNSFEPIVFPKEKAANRQFVVAQFLKEQVLNSDISNFGLGDKIQSFDINQPVGENQGDLPEYFVQEDLNIIMNKKFNFDIFEEVLNDPLTPYEDEVLRILRNPSEEDNYRDAPVFLDIPNVGYSQGLETPILLGFIINKFEVISDGSLIPFPDIVVKNPVLNEIIDVDVIYGKTYYYKIRSIFQVTIPALPSDDSVLNSSIRYLNILVSSRLIESFISCQEKSPPPPPDNISFFWKGEKGLMICWNIPFNLQEDIKRIQIFRRENINHPFELLKEIRFDDFESPPYTTGIPENIPLDDIIVSPDRKSYNIKHLFDEEFNKDSKYIYALCSIDAHFYTSNYSIQYEISYDKILNSIKVSGLSRAGAPKPYPNLFLEKNNFILNSLKVGGKKSRKVKILFSPTFFKCFKNNVFNPNNQVDELKILSSQKGGYNFQIINLDNHKKIDLKFKISDIDSLL